MGWEPITYCKTCGDPFDVYAAPDERICECCLELEMLETDAEFAKARYEAAKTKREQNERAR